MKNNLHRIQFVKVPNYVSLTLSIVFLAMKAIILVIRVYPEEKTSEKQTLLRGDKI
jgi:hypothetical protein